MIVFLVVKEIENFGLTVLDAKVYKVIPPESVSAQLVLDDHLTAVIQAMVGFEYQDEAELRAEVWDVINTTDCDILIAKV